MESGIIKWHVHCTVCGAFIEKSSNSNSEIMCNKCHTTLEIFVKPKKEEEEDDQPEGLETGDLETVEDDEKLDDEPEDFEDSEK